MTAKERCITQAYALSRLSYDPHTGLLHWRPREVLTIYDVRWNGRYAGTVAGTVNFQGYVVITLDKYKLLAHRLIWLMMTGFWPVCLIDHRNTVKRDNHWDNLREATTAENGWNVRKARGISGVKGVHFDKSKGLWVAHIMVNRHVKNLGRFRNKDDAVAARRTAEARWHGEFSSRIIPTPDQYQRSS